MSRQKIKLGFSILVVIILLLLAGLLFRVGTRENLPQESPTIDITEVVLGDLVIPVELADTSTKRQQGLSGREFLPDGTGMLFIFPEPYVHGFWMKDMLFSLDMVWLDKDACIVDIHEGVSPDTYPSVFRPKSSAQFVLELAAGFVKENNIQVGGCAFLG